VVDYVSLVRVIYLHLASYLQTSQSERFRQAISAGKNHVFIQYASQNTIA